ncbi:hypothetical protein AB0C10_21885 [Microbispora amethystogenes]|uniref:hypothetical protein n=1 Tax=Microbispora amethystogenes TaxID=1427754 RepID=UPI0033F98BB0
MRPDGLHERERFVHLVRLSWDLRCLELASSLVVRPHARPILEVPLPAGKPVHVQAIHRPHGWVFAWRPWWSRTWRRGEWVWALDENAAAKIKTAVGQ